MSRLVWKAGTATGFWPSTTSSSVGGDAGCETSSSSAMRSKSESLLSLSLSLLSSFSSSSSSSSKERPQEPERPEGLCLRLLPNRTDTFFALEGRFHPAAHSSLALLLLLTRYASSIARAVASTGFPSCRTLCTAWWHSLGKSQCSQQLCRRRTCSASFFSAKRSVSCSMPCSSARCSSPQAVVSALCGSQRRLVGRSSPPSFSSSFSPDVVGVGVVGKDCLAPSEEGSSGWGRGPWSCLVVRELSSRVRRQAPRAAQPM